MPEEENQCGTVSQDFWWRLRVLPYPAPHLLQWRDALVPDEELPAVRKYLECTPLHEVGWDFDLISRKEYANLNSTQPNRLLFLYKRLSDFQFLPKRPSHLISSPLLLSLSPMTTSHTSLIIVGDILCLNLRLSVVPTYSVWQMGS